MSFNKSKRVATKSLKKCLRPQVCADLFLPLYRYSSLFKPDTILKELSYIFSCLYLYFLSRCSITSTFGGSGRSGSGSANVTVVKAPTRYGTVQPCQPAESSAV